MPLTKHYLFYPVDMIARTCNQKHEIEIHPKFIHTFTNLQGRMAQKTLIQNIHNTYKGCNIPPNVYLQCKTHITCISEPFDVYSALSIKNQTGHRE